MIEGVSIPPRRSRHAEAACRLVRLRAGQRAAPALLRDQSPTSCWAPTNGGTRTLWRPHRRQGVRLFLGDSEGRRGTCSIRGSSAAKPQHKEPPAIIVSDPHELPELEVANYAAGEDLTSQFRAYGKRAVTFHSEPFPRDTEIAGQMRLTLNANRTRRIFDLWAQVQMVIPDGSTVRLGEDVRRARFRHSQFNAELVKPGEVVEIPFEFNWLARRIPAGARLTPDACPFELTQLSEELQSGRPDSDMNKSTTRALRISTCSTT